MPTSEGWRHRQTPAWCRRLGRGTQPEKWLQSGTRDRSSRSEEFWPGLMCRRSRNASSAAIQNVGHRRLPENFRWGALSYDNASLDDEHAVRPTRGNRRQQQGLIFQAERGPRKAGGSPCLFNRLWPRPDPQATFHTLGAEDAGWRAHASIVVNRAGG